MRTLAILFLFLFPQKPGNPLPLPNDPDDPSIQRQLLQGDVKVPKSGKVTIPFFPPFARTPSCIVDAGEVVQDTAEFIQLKNIKRKRIHFECKGIKRYAGPIESAGSRAMQLVRQGIYPQEGQAEMLFAQSQHEAVALDAGRQKRAQKKFTRMEEYQS